jgi:hypothetical protein
VKDSLSQVTLSCARIALKQNDRIISSTITDYEGFFFIDKVAKGNYTLVVSYADKSKEFSDIEVLKNSISYTLEIDPTKEIPITIAVGYKNLITPERLDIYEADFLDNLGIVNIKEIETISVAQVETTEGISYKGSRPGTSVYYIDGMRTYGDLNIPMSAVESVVIYNGGIPAQYGNTTSVVIVVETKSYLADF